MKTLSAVCRASSRVTPLPWHNASVYDGSMPAATEFDDPNAREDEDELPSDFFDDAPEFDDPEDDD